MSRRFKLLDGVRTWTRILQYAGQMEQDMQEGENWKRNNKSRQRAKMREKTNARKGILWLNAGRNYRRQKEWTEMDRLADGWKDERGLTGWGGVCRGIRSDGHFIMSGNA